MGKYLESLKAGARLASLALRGRLLPELHEKGGTIGVTRDDLRIYRSLSSILRESGNHIYRPYEQVGWVYASISLIAQNIARLPFKCCREGSNV
jgi:hypothetical protein